MTSISHQTVLPQASSNVSQTIAPTHTPLASSSGTTSPQAAVPAPATARSYANATRKAFSPPGPSSDSNSIAAVGGSAPVQHGKSESVSPVNGKTVIPPAIPSLGINGNAPSNNSEHVRKPSVTISNAGISGYMPNGGPIGGKPIGGKEIHFGSMKSGGSPPAGYSSAQVSQSNQSLAVGTPTNPRVTSPQTSPSPIPQPPASGGRPPSSLHGQANALSFGSVVANEEAAVSKCVHDQGIYH